MWGKNSANVTDASAASVHGTNPQNLIEKITRSKIYNHAYWKEHCFGLTAESLVDKAMELEYVGGTFGGIREPTVFMQLMLKMLQIQPEKEIVVEFIKNEDYKYVRALGAFYMRLVGRPVEIYQYLEPLYNDYRKIRRRLPEGNYTIVRMDELIDEMLRQTFLFDIALPHLPKRIALQAAGQLAGGRRSALEDDLEELEGGLEELVTAARNEAAAAASKSSGARGEAPPPPPPPPPSTGGEAPAERTKQGAPSKRSRDEAEGGATEPIDVYESKQEARDEEGRRGKGRERRDHSEERARDRERERGRRERQRSYSRSPSRSRNSRRRDNDREHYRRYDDRSSDRRRDRRDDWRDERRGRRESPRDRDRDRDRDRGRWQDSPPRRRRESRSSSRGRRSASSGSSYSSASSASEKH